MDDVGLFIQSQLCVSPVCVAYMPFIVLTGAENIAIRDNPEFRAELISATRPSEACSAMLCFLTSILLF